MIRKPLAEKQNVICPFCGYCYSDCFRDGITEESDLFWLCQKCGKETKREKQTVNQFIVTCPFCQSTNCKKISGASKIGKVALFGVFAAGNVSKTWHCNNCGSNFG